MQDHDRHLAGQGSCLPDVPLLSRFLIYLIIFQGVDAEYVSLENIVPFPDDGEVQAETETLGQEFYDKVAAAVGKRILECGPRVPVVTGTLSELVSRNTIPDVPMSRFLWPGSWLAASPSWPWLHRPALCAISCWCTSFRAANLEGGRRIFTADPRKVPTARLIPIISPEEAAELTYYGSEVVHPFTMEQVRAILSRLDYSDTDHCAYLTQVIRKRIPIRIKNVENPKGGGTVIHPDPEIDAVSATQEASAAASGTATQQWSYKSLAQLTTQGGPLHTGSDVAHKHPTAVTIKENIVVLNVNSNRKNVSHGFLAGIFGVLDRFSVVVDLISTSEVYVSMAIEQGVEKRALDKVVRELKKYGSVSVCSLSSCSQCAAFAGASTLPDSHTNNAPSLGHRLAGHGHPFARREAHAASGGYRRTHVHYPGPGQREHRDDQPGGERNQHILRHRRPGRHQGPESHPPELPSN